MLRRQFARYYETNSLSRLGRQCEAPRTPDHNLIGTAWR